MMGKRQTMQIYAGAFCMGMRVRMIRKKIQETFFHEGYRFFGVKSEETGRFTTVFYKYYQEGFHVVMAVDMERGCSMSGEQHRIMADRIKSIFYHPQGKLADFPEGFPVYHVELLTILVGNDIEQIRMLCASGENIWGYLTEGAQLLIYENQPGDFWGLRQALEEMQQAFHQQTASDFSAESAGKKRWAFSEIKSYPYITIVIVAVNVIVYLILEWLGDTKDAVFIASHGGMYPLFLLYDNQWWRVLTAGFLHFGVAHLANNMLVFALLGERLERAVGHVRMIVIYLLSLIGGGLLSYAVMIYAGTYAVSAGASGAVFGVIGGMLWLVLIHRGRFEEMTTRRFVFMIVLSLYYGFSSLNVDNWAHIGGLLTGFIVTGILCHRKCHRKT